MFSSFNLPKIITSAVEGVNTRVNELSTRISQSFGGAGAFKKPITDAMTFAESAQKHAFRAAEIAQQNAMAIEDALAQYQNQYDVISGTGGAIVDGETRRLAEAALNASVSARSAKAALTQSEAADDHLVKLIEKRNGVAYHTVAFTVMPEVTESRNAEYEAVAPPQSPGAFQKYKGTASTQWTVNARLICRTTPEATENLRILNQLRTWLMPYFGVETQAAHPDKTGAPPPVLEFSGWRDGMVGPVPVVITSLQWSFPQDVDYIPAFSLFDSTVNTTPKVPFPTVMTVQLTLVESFSAEQFNGFDLEAFRNGDFRGAWMPLRRSQSDLVPTVYQNLGSQVDVRRIDNLIEEAQTVKNVNYSNEGRNFSTFQVGTENYGNEGRNFSTFQVGTENYGNEGRNYRKPTGEVRRVVSEVKPAEKFKSGGGGSFAGGGASNTPSGDGDW